MVNSRTRDIDETFFALSDPTRREILERLSRRQMTVAELARPFDVSAPAISKHLRVLERANLIEQSRDGRNRICRLNAKPMQEASEFLHKYRKFWEQQLDRLAGYLDNLSRESKEPK